MALVRDDNASTDSVQDGQDVCVANDSTSTVQDEDGPTLWPDTDSEVGDYAGDYVERSPAWHAPGRPELVLPVMRSITQQDSYITGEASAQCPPSPLLLQQLQSFQPPGVHPQQMQPHVQQQPRPHPPPPRHPPQLQQLQLQTPAAPLQHSSNFLASVFPATPTGCTPTSSVPMHQLTLATRPVQQGGSCSPTQRFSTSATESRLQSKETDGPEVFSPTSPTKSRRRKAKGKDVAGDDERITTVMVRNLPKSLRQTELVHELDLSGFEGEYDFCYLPCNFSDGRSRGYAFINFRNPKSVPRFREQWHKSDHFCESHGSSLLDVKHAHIQGLEANAAMARDNIKNPGFRRLIFDSSEVDASAGQSCPTSPVPSPVYHQRRSSRQSSLQSVDSMCSFASFTSFTRLSSASAHQGLVAPPSPVAKQQGQAPALRLGALAGAPARHHQGLMSSNMVGGSWAPLAATTTAAPAQWAPVNLVAR